MLVWQSQATPVQLVGLAAWLAHMVAHLPRAALEPQGGALPLLALALQETARESAPSRGECY